MNSRPIRRLAPGSARPIRSAPATLTAARLAAAHGRRCAVPCRAAVPCAMQRDAALDAVFMPVRPPTTFEETVERLGTAIRVGLLAPGSRLPAERELARELGSRARRCARR